MARSLRDLDTVDWDASVGAYGPSRDSTRRTDVAAQLKELVSEDEDTAEDALWGGLGTHVCHQGDIYEVTSFVVPFIVGIVDDRAVSRRGDVAELLVRLGESARRYAGSDDQAHRAIGERTRRALLDDAGSLARWWTDEDDRVAEAGVTLAWLIEELRAPLIEHMKSLRRPPSATELTALALLPDARDEGWAVDTGASMVRDVAAPRPARVAAALLLQLSQRKAPPDVDPFVDELTAPHERAALSDVFEIPDFTFPLRTGPSTLGAQIVFVGPMLFLARTAEGRQFTVRWPSSGLQKGDTVRLAQISMLGIARSMEIRPGTEDSITKQFDGRGLPAA